MIRGFKLEMSDAQHITDVYSEVAAISASDTQELATAMSKTASSAASVGMSFENTTAMIATMVEATRESATNIGSAMKSIISRMSEMKAGLSQDENGEFLDASKVETALKSVGVALRDSQGQFRDLDQVIIELGERWSSLDSATKRYLGTIIAGNRQQSRFLALMENYDRFVEIQESAMNAEDAGVLQYAKTLDSLESKLNQISNSFQQFYMSILNGPVIGSFLSFLNQVITGFTKLGNFSSLFNIISIVKGVKTLASFLLTTFSDAGTSISIKLKQAFQEAVGVAREAGRMARLAYEDGFNGTNLQPNITLPTASNGGATGGKLANIFTNLKQNPSALWNLGLNLAGGVFSAIGAVSSGSGHTGWGAGLSAIGSGLSGASIGLSLGGPVGAAIGGVAGVLSQLPAVIQAIGNSLEQEVENLKKKTEELNIRRVEDKQAAEDLSSYIEKYNKLRAAQYDSAEAAQEYVDVQNEIAEKFPQYVSYFDEGGNAIINMSTATEDLSRALNAAAESSARYAQQLTEQYRKEFELARQKVGLSGKSFIDSTYSGTGISAKGFRFIETGIGKAYGAYLPGATVESNWQTIPQVLAGNAATKKLTAESSMEERVNFAKEMLGVESLNDAINKMNVGNQQERNIYGSILTSIFGSNALSSKVVDGKRIFSLSDELSDYQKAESTYKNSLPSGIATMTKSYAATYANIGQYASTLSRFNGEDALISQMIKDAGITDPEKYKQTDYDKYADVVGNWLLNTEDELADTLQEYLSNWDSVSQEELDKFIQNAGLPPEMADAIRNSYDQTSFDINERLTKNIEAIADETSKQNYDNLFNSGKLTNTQKAQINDEIVTTNKIIENKDKEYTEAQVEAAKSRQQLILDAYKVLDEKGDDITPAQRAEFEQALYEDIGTYDWAKKLKLLADKYGIQIKGIDNAVYETLNARLAAMTDNSELFTNLSSAVNSQFGSGFGTLSDAKQMQQKLGLSGKDFDDVFEWRDSESAYFFKDWNQTYEEVIGTTTRQLQNLQDLDDVLTQFQDDLSGMSKEDLWTAISRSEQFQALDPYIQAALKDVYDAADSTAEALIDVIASLADAALGLSDTLRQSGATEAEATAQSVAAELKKRRKDFSSISDFADAAQYFNESKNGYDTVKLREETGLIYDNMTDTLTKGREYLEKQLTAASGDEEYTKNIQKQIDQMKLDTEEYVKGLTGKITQEQIDQLDAYGISTANLTVGQNWEAVQLAWNDKADTLGGAELARLNAIKVGKAQYSKSSTAKSVASDMENLLTAMAEGSEVAVNDLVDIWETLTGNTATSAERQAMEEAMAGGWQSVAAYLQKVITEAGYSNELAKAVGDIFDAIIDAVREGASTGITALKNGASGTLSRADITDLAKRSGIAEETLIAGATGGLGGYKLDTNTLLQVAGGLSSQNPLYTRDIASQLIDAGAIKSYKDLQKQIETVNKQIEEGHTELEDTLKVLEQMDDVWKNMSDNSDWFNQDIYGDTDDKFQDYVSKIEKGSELMRSIRDGEQIEWSDAHWITSLVAESETFQNTLAANGKSLADFRDAINKSRDLSTGQVNFNQALKSMNMSFEDFGEGFAESARNFAKSRIEYLQGLLKFLDSQEAFANALTKEDGAIVEAFQGLGQAAGQGTTTATTAINNLRTAMDTAVADAFGEGNTFASVFHVDIMDLIGLDAKQIGDLEGTAKDEFVQFANSISGWMSDALLNAEWSDTNDSSAYLQNVWQELITKITDFAKTHQDLPIKIPLSPQMNGTTPEGTGVEAATESVTNSLTDTTTAINNAEEAFKNFGQTGQEELNKIKTAMTDLTTQLNSLKESFNLGSSETPMEVQLKAVISEYTNAEGVAPDELVGALVATVNKFLPAEGVDQNSLVSDLTALVHLTSNPEELYNYIATYMSAKKVSVAIQFANDGNEEALANLWGDLSPVEQSLVTLNATSETAAATLNTVAINYASIGTTASNTSAAVATAESTNQANIKATGDAADTAKGQLEDMADGDYDISVGADTSPAISAANQAVKNINAKSATIRVTTVYTNQNVSDDSVANRGAYIGGGGGREGNTFKQYDYTGGGILNRTRGGFYKGTVNGLGPAYAQGTLVGELGPELAVYDNAYHLLGRNGAELVNIPDDAIIFNHKQTEGILKGQANTGRGKVLNGQAAFATGNVSGPAYASGISGARKAIQDEISMWQSFIDATMEDLLGSAGGGGGGGSGNTLKAHIEDLVEWYNLSRQIADIEQKINNIIAKRENLTDGREYLKSLREQQHLLEGQAIVQRTLLGYQQKQLELQAEQINTHDIWKQFFHVGSDGLLQYNMGNEVNGGKGTLTLLQQLNQMSGAEQLSYIKNLGYSYVTNDGEQLDGEDLISKFFEEAQAQIDKYDELRDTVESTDEALSKLESSINEIEQEIRDNQKELEEIIYNTLVEAWEKQISQLQEQTDMLREANEAYVNGLNDALNKERNQYSQNKSISDRQQLQRQLSLLRRSGGSASQIASLEEQLNSALKEEYFSHQQETIDSIKEANDKQLDALNKQITLQQETLDFQKENGVLWTKVYEVLSQSDGKIMEFLIQNSSEFIQASALAQADMLNEEWAKRIGIYKANSEEGFEPYVQKANQMFATEAWNSAEGPKKQSMFNALDVASQKALQDYFASAFANEMLRNGGDEAAAYEVARQDMYQKLYQAYNQMKNIQNTTLDAIRNISQPSVAPKDNAAGTGDGGGSNTGSGSKDNSGSSQKQWLRITYKGLVTTGNSKGKSNGGSPSGPSSLEVGKSGSISWNCYPGFVQGGFKVSDTSKCSVSGSSITALASGSVTVTLNYWDRTPTPAGASKATTTVKSSTNSSSSAAKIGGGSSGNSLLKKNLFANSLYAASGAFIESDDTPAILHKGEGVFTAGETSALRNMVKNYQTLAANLTGNSLLSAIGGIGSYSFSNTRNAGSELNINPGAVVIHVDKLDDKYDVDELATDVFNKLSTIASKATNRGVNRR